MADGSKNPPIIPIEGWQKPENRHRYARACKHYGNVGFISGVKLQDGSVVYGFDQDNLETFESLCLPATTTWETRPGRTGKLFVCNEIPASLRLEYNKKPDLAQFKFYQNGVGVGEVKMERSYQVIPDSWKLLEDGTRVSYRMLDERAPARLDITKLVHAILAITGVSLFKNGENKRTKPTTEKTLKEYMPVEADNSPAEAPDARNLSYYAYAALLSELAKVEKTLEGGRYDQVYASACALGEFVGANLLPYDPTYRSLVESGEKSGITRAQAAQSTRNGLAQGMKHPRHLSRPTSTKTEVRA